VLKGVLIILVVFGHMNLLQFFVERDPLFEAVFAAVYLFHMPLFALVSGILAKPALAENDYRKMFSRLLLPLIVFQAFYLVILQVGEGDADRHLLDPQWMLWFLLSLCLWRMLLPLFLQIPLALPASVAIAIAAGYSQHIGFDLSLSRTLYFFPFFLAGYLGRNRLPALVRRVRPLWGLAFAAAIAVIVFWSLRGLDPVVLYGAHGYDVATAWPGWPGLGRLGVMMLSAIASVGFMALTPGASRWLARLGQRTLVVFALHGPVVLVSLSLIKRAGATASPELLPALLALAVVIAWGLSLLDGPFNRFFDWLAAHLSPKGWKAPKPDPEASRRT
jgi:fucose 4-O-acetylase-like acetyltransferase